MISAISTRQFLAPLRNTRPGFKSNAALTLTEQMLLLGIGDMFLQKVQAKKPFDWDQFTEATLPAKSIFQPVTPGFNQKGKPVFDALASKGYLQPLKQIVVTAELNLPIPVGSSVWETKLTSAGAKHVFGTLQQARTISESL